MLADEIIRVIHSTFSYLQFCVDSGSGRLYIPTNENSIIRLSEGEIRSAFIEQFLNTPYFQSYSYSIETPTEISYRFSCKDGRVSPSVDLTGRKANIDACILKGGKRIAIIEFKANNAGPFEHGKDFIKLLSEPGANLLRFFVEVYSSTDDSTLRSIHEKLYSNKYQNIGGNTMFLGYSLNHKGYPKNGLIVCNPDSSSATINVLEK